MLDTIDPNVAIACITVVIATIIYGNHIISFITNTIRFLVSYHILNYIISI